MLYPHPPQLIPATPELIKDWTGPLTARYSGFAQSTETLYLDPLRPEVRDHLIRHFNLPTWMRDGPNRLEPWQSAGLIACAAAGRVPILLLLPWKEVILALSKEILYLSRPVYHDSSSGTIVFVNEERRKAHGRPRDGHGWWIRCLGLPTKLGGFETGDSGKQKADELAPKVGCALLMDENTMILPWKDGPKTWTRA